MIAYSSFRRSAAAIFACAALAACSSSDSATPAPADGMSWNVDGSTTTANSYQPNVSGSDIILTGSYLTSTALRSVTLTLPLQAGTYDLATVGAAVKAAYRTGDGTTNGTTYYATAGTATVTRATATTLAGTFSFSGTDAAGAASKTISGGTFNVKLP